MEMISEERLLYLSRQVTHMHVSGVDRRELAEIALETLVTRLELEQMIQQEQLPGTQKQSIERNLKRLAELEKGIVSLYFIGRLRGERWADGSIFNSIMKRYTFEREK